MCLQYFVLYSHSSVGSIVLVAEPENWNGVEREPSNPGTLTTVGLHEEKSSRGAGASLGSLEEQY